MKLLTLNTHSWLEDQQLIKIQQLATKIQEEHYQIVAFQEVNQLQLSGSPSASIQRDNLALILVNLLKEKGLNYHYRWIPTHQSYQKFDEGLAILSLFPIVETVDILISPLSLTYHDYQRRRALGIKIQLNQQAIWFYSVHFSWWQSDPKIGFQYEWATFNQHLQESQSDSLIFLLGDFNNPANVTNQGYDLICSHDWHDSFTLAKNTYGEATIEKSIAGWEGNNQSIRIDYIFCSTPLSVQASTICFNNHNGPIISDHFGLQITLLDSVFYQK